jgi:hypothetical protein
MQIDQRRLARDKAGWKYDGSILDCRYLTPEDKTQNWEPNF